MNNNQQNQPTITIDIPSLLIDSLKQKGALDLHSEELTALLSGLPKETNLDIEAAVNELVTRMAEHAFKLGWQLARS